MWALSFVQGSDFVGICLREDRLGFRVPQSLRARQCGPSREEHPDEQVSAPHPSTSRYGMPIPSRPADRRNEIHDGLIHVGVLPRRFGVVMR